MTAVNKQHLPQDAIRGFEYVHMSVLEFMFLNPRLYNLNPGMICKMYSQKILLICFIGLLGGYRKSLEAWQVC